MTDNKKTKKDLQKDVISVYTSAGLATALISWLTTAEGLHQFVFKQLWQAYVISGAVQSALFACNIKGPDIMRTLKVKGKIIFALFYVMVLLTSSIFSFVYIEQVAYPEAVLQDDAERILITKCLEMNYALDNAIDQAVEEEKKNIDSYILALAEGAADASSADDSVEISTHLGDLLREYKATKDEGNELDSLILLLEKINQGQYNNSDIALAKNTLATLKEELDTRISENEVRVNQNSENININSKRMETYSNTTNEKYKNLEASVETAKAENEEIDKNIEKWRTQVFALNNFEVELEQIDSGLVHNLQKNVNSMQEAMNEDQIDTALLLVEAETVYANLIENNVSSEDERLSGYSSFKQDVENYAQMREVQSDVSEEIIMLNDRYRQMSEADSQNVGEDSITTDVNDQWHQYWQARIGKIRTNVKDIPDESFHDIDLGNVQIKNNVSAKSFIIQEMTDTERLYVSDLNQFEKAWSLLLEEHPYKKMVVFSLLFALFMDVFSAMMGILIYQYKKSQMKED